MSSLQRQLDRRGHDIKRREAGTGGFMCSNCGIVRSQRRTFRFYGCVGGDTNDA